MALHYYAVTCKQGHHGARRYEPITFAIAAESIFDACDYARQMPGVKHSQPVMKCVQISQRAYYELRCVSAYKRNTLPYERTG